jgi:hypothetical protein
MSKPVWEQTLQMNVLDTEAGTDTRTEVSLQQALENPEGFRKTDLIRASLELFDIDPDSAIKSEIVEAFRLTALEIIKKKTAEASV